MTVSRNREVCSVRSILKDVPKETDRVFRQIRRKQETEAMRRAVEQREKREDRTRRRRRRYSLCSIV